MRRQRLLLLCGMCALLGGMAEAQAKHFLLAVKPAEENVQVQSYQPANDVRAFVYQWFHWFDVHAPQEKFLAHLAEEGLELRYPESTLRSHAEFVTWYQGIGHTILSNSHEVSDLEVTALAQGRYQITLRVWWRAVTTEGKVLSVQVRQTWQVQRQQDQFIVEKLHAELIE